MDQQISSSTLSVLAGLPEEETAKILKTLIDEGKPVTQAAVKKQKKQRERKEKPVQCVLTTRIIISGDQLEAVIKESNTGLEQLNSLQLKEKLIELLTSFGIRVKD